jgi:hypothetical protein
MSLKQWIVLKIEQACDVFDRLPWLFEGELVRLGDVWQHPLARRSLDLDDRWDTGIWRAEGS